MKKIKQTKPEKEKKEISEIGYIKPREIVKEMEDSYTDYAMSVIVSRALPDVRDGLKPVHRRILYAMNEMGLTHGAKFRKSANVVGRVMGDYHPHGDMAIYDALVRMAQDFSLRYPLIQGQGNFGCFTKDTKIRLTDGRNLSFEKLIKEQAEGKKHWTFSFDDKTKKVEVTEIKNPRLTKEGEKIIELTLDNGEKIRCTPNHRFMLKNGEYKEAASLKIEDSLMPLYSRIYDGKEDKNLKGYEIIYQPVGEKWEFVHHLSDKWNLENHVYTIKNGRIRHHKDFDKLNNNPDNILRIQWQNHWQYHKEIASSRHKNSPGYVQKIAEGRNNFWLQKENREKMSQFRTGMNERMWANPKYRKMWSEAKVKMWENPEYKEFMRNASRANLKSLWQRKDFKELLSNLKSVEMKKRWESEQFRNSQKIRTRETSLRLWADPKHREYISKLMKEKYQTPERRAGQSKTSQELWNNSEYRAKFPADHFSKMAKKLWKNTETRELHRNKAIKQWKDSGFRNLITELSKQRGKQLAKENPELMKMMARKAKIALKKNWENPEYKNKVIRNRILRYVNSLFKKHAKTEITPEVYNNERNKNCFPKFKNAIKYFSNFSEILEKAENYNHKIVSMKILSEREDVYDLTIDRLHNFLLGAGVFVHNSIDNDPPAAQRYCISGDSLVITNRCLERIDEVSKTEDISLKVLSFDGKVNNASKLFDSGIHPVVEIKTRRGYSLKGTFNHPILTLAPGLNGAPFFKWKLLNEVKRGDFAVIDRNDQVLWPKKEPLLKRFYPKIEKRNFKTYKLPVRMNEDLAFLMGAIVAEGYVSLSREKKCGKIGFCNTDKEYSDIFRSKFKKLFSGTHICEQKRKPLSFGKKEFNSFEICSIYLVEFFNNLGVKMVPSREKQVPRIIFHSTKKSVAAFLRGFVEEDGSIVVLKERRSPEVYFISVSKKLLQEIQLLLLRFGIDSFLRLDKNKGNWILTIRGKDNIRLFSEIGFISAIKKEKLRKYGQVDENYHAISKTGFIPFLSDYLRNKYKKEKIKWVFKDWLTRHNIDRYSKLRKYYDVISQFLDKNDLLSVGSFMKNHYLFDRVESIKLAGSERVYSFRVDNKCHSFVSNGFISHNTECRLSRYGDEMMLDIEKDTVNYTDNYDGSKKEPLVLPSPLPQLLLNGSLGIAVGMATNIPTHNLTEISDAMTYLLDNPKATTEDLLKYVKGPDFPTGGIIYDQKGIVETYSTGKGSIVMRGKADIVEEEKSNRHQIIITEIPFQVQKSSLIEQFANLVQEKKIEGIKDIRDESDKDGMRIVIDLHKEAYPAKILNRLYKFTDLQKSFHLNMLALVNGVEPRVLALNDLLSYFISHRKEVVYRRTKFDLDRAKERVHILEGFKICLDNIDAVIKLIRGSENKDDAKVRLIKRFKLTEIQALAILEMRLHQLAKLERSKIEEELNEKLKLIKELTAILKSQEKIKEIIKKEIIELRNNFGDNRRTKVINQKVGEIAEEDLVPDEETIVTLTHEGYIKRINPTVYKIQHRGGKGLLGMKTMQDDIVEHFLASRTHDFLMFFTDSGKVFRTAVYEIPEGTRVARGRGLLNFLEISPQDRVLSLFTLNKADHDEGVKNLIMVTRNGIVKKTVLDEFNNVRRSGLIAITLKKGDSLKKVTKSCGNDDVILVTKKGQAIRFKEKEIREMGRPASGVKGIRLKKNDEIMGMEIIAGLKLKPADLKDKNAKPRKQYLLVVMDNGYGKKTEVGEYRSQGRGGGGIKTANVNAKTGDVIASWLLTGEEEDLIVISQKGQVIRTEIKSIPVLGRATQGVRIMRLDEGDKVASATCI